MMGIVLDIDDGDSVSKDEMMGIVLVKMMGIVLDIDDGDDGWIVLDIDDGDSVSNR